MKYIITFFIITLLYGFFIFGRIFYASKHSKNPNIAQSEFTLGTGPSLRYIAAGDSTAVGEGASTLEYTYPYKIAVDMSQDHIVSYKNVAVRGAKTQDVIELQVPKIVEYNPDIITLSIGANDATHLISKKVILENYREIISELTAKTRAQIYITDIPNFTGASLLPVWYIRILEYRSEKINVELKKLETDRVKIINIHDFGWDQYPDRSVTYSLDNFHPNDEGYQNWANAFLDKIR